MSLQMITVGQQEGQKLKHEELKQARLVTKAHIISNHCSSHQFYDVMNRFYDVIFLKYNMNLKSYHFIRHKFFTIRYK